MNSIFNQIQNGNFVTMETVTSWIQIQKNACLALIIKIL